MAAPAESKVDVMGIEMKGEEYIDLMSKVIGEVKYVQNSNPDLVPQEDRIIKHLLDVLKPHSTENGGPLIVDHVSYVEGRGNLIIKYPGKSDRTISFVGSHLDVVPADPEKWDYDPFKLTVEGDKLYGRGTTDCLGHVAALTLFFRDLAVLKPELDVTVQGCFIASEESFWPGVGVDALEKAGKLADFKKGPCIWVDSADSNPCLGTAGVMTWHLDVSGKLFHSGLPHRGINALEFGMEASKVIQDRFYKDFPPHPMEAEYKFATPSTMKPTQIKVPPGGLNQVPGECRISGDIRFTPFYKSADIMAAVEKYVAEINEDLTTVGTRGPCSRYQLADGTKGGVKLTWGGTAMSGIACKLDSPGLTALKKGITQVKGKCEPYSICGSLPLVGELQEAGYDLQVTGFGLLSTYHANNEYCLLSDMLDAVKVFDVIVSDINATK